MLSPPIPYEIYSHSYGMGALLAANLGMWCTTKFIKNIAFIEHVKGAQYGHPIFGWKGVNNSFVLQMYAQFKTINGNYQSSILPCLYHLQFAHMRHAVDCLHQYFNYRMYDALNTLWHASTLLMYTRISFQRLRYLYQLPLSTEEWLYI